MSKIVLTCAGSQFNGAEKWKYVLRSQRDTIPESQLVNQSSIPRMMALGYLVGSACQCLGKATALVRQLLL